jgi:hypothetical protein
VILGAGASTDSATADYIVRPEWRPPLVKDLFSSRYSSVLDDYPFAQEVAADLGPDERPALSIEQFIRERYRGSDHPPDRRKYHSIPLYLQELLHTCTGNFARAPDNYLRLMSALLKLPETLFVTLNYDLLLDWRLSYHSPILSLADYISQREPQWSLIKLHGSVNWGRAIRGPQGFNFEVPPADLDLDDQIVITGGARTSVDELRGDGPTSYYPALSVPVGEDDELVCPPLHVEFFQDRLATADALHLLIIGYSANDLEVLKLLKESETEIESVLIVNRSEEDCGHVEGQLARHLGVRFGPIGRPYFPHGFGRFTVERLPRYVDQIRPQLGA